MHAAHDTSIAGATTVPDGWTISTLGNLCDVIADGTHQTPSYVARGIPFYSVENVTANEFRSVKYITESEHRRLSKHCRLQRGDILMTRIGSLADTKLIDWDVEASIYVSLAMLRPGRGIDPSFLYAYTKSARFVKDVEDRSLLWAVPKKINMGDIAPVPIVFPVDPSEQRAISHAILDVERQVSAIERLIAKKQALKQGVMQQLLTGTTRLPGFGGPWAECSIGGVSVVDPETLAANTSRREIIDYVSLEDVSRGVMLGSSQLSFGTAPSRARRVIRQMDVLFGTVRPNLQSHAIYTGGLRRPVASTGFAVVRALKGVADASFLFYLLMSRQASVQIDRIIAGSNYPAVSSGDVRKLVFDFPDLKEQEAISGVLADCDHELEALHNCLAKARAVKQGIMQELLTGGTRLPMRGIAS